MISITTADLIDSLRADIIRNLREELLAELEPEIQRRLYANILNIKEASAYLKISESTLRKMVSANEIPFFRQRGQIFFRQIDIDKHLEKLVSQTMHERR
ncbi:helix-turn-helix domain-containing protein [Paenibacillus pinihumi]|uniref:helix-turn-helix domain-containing protein n=1 Tax=Paenibacillus pinihumi TaxID=669462 RepID=UPI0004296980|nr:helix-turn-helix domain-containing protein [Paenibacillus pinihumi]